MVITKPASESKTLQFNKLAAIVAAVAAFAPTVVSIILDVFADPALGAAVADFIPAEYRALVLLVVAFLAKRNSDLRKQTSTPIAGTPAAAKLAETVRAVTEETAAKE